MQYGFIPFVKIFSALKSSLYIFFFSALKSSFPAGGPNHIIRVYAALGLLVKLTDLLESPYEKEQQPRYSRYLFSAGT
jgi:hypothetical protein